jgi:hypothetical protein
MNATDVTQSDSQAQINMDLPAVILPAHHVRITDTATHLFKLIGPKKRMFTRSGVPVVCVTRDDGTLGLEILRAATARSMFEKYCRFLVYRQTMSGLVLKPTNCSRDVAEALLQSAEATRFLLRIRGLINSPILRAINGHLSVAAAGYDDETHLLITGGSTPPDVTVEDAVKSLLKLLDEFDFQSAGDKARAMASLISPALKMGGFLKGRVPADVAEADKSQSGKTYRQKMMAAIYNEKVSLVTSRERGVGSIDESLDQQLINGRPFIQFDNFRGRFASAHLEAFLTAEGTFPCRVPYRNEVLVAPEDFFIMLTSNGVDTTRDLANRSNIIRIRKKPNGYAFKKYPEGDLLRHVMANQPLYLGYVFAVIAEWHKRGTPRTDESRHDFREWVQTVDYIVQKIFGMAPVMEGHQEAQERVSNPNHVWLRGLVMAIVDAGECDRALTATELCEICENADLTVPGLRPGADAEKGKKLIGIVMGKLFRDEDTLQVDQFVISRDLRYVDRALPSDGGAFKSKVYTVSRPQHPVPAAATQPPQ